MTVPATHPENEVCPASPAANSAILEAILGGTNHIIIACDLHGIIQTFNPAAERALGYAAQEVTGKYSLAQFHDKTELERAALELSVELDHAIEPAFLTIVRRAQLLGIDNVEWTFVARDASRFPVQLSLSTLHDSTGGTIGYLGVATMINVHSQLDEAGRTENELRERLERERVLSRSDCLTGVYNRRAFLEIAEAELERARRYRHPLSLAFFDLDGFKKINDELGHQAGDELLALVARTIKSCVRRTDCLARLGGDEFALLMPETAQNAAESVIVKVRLALLEATRNAGRSVTCSIGLTTQCPPPASLQEVLSTADGLMYMAKQSGKNRIVKDLANPATALACYGNNPHFVFSRPDGRTAPAVMF